MKKLLALAAVFAFAVVAHAENITLKVEGMTCPEGCVNAVKDAVTKVKGVKDAKVVLGKAEVNFDAKTASKKDLITAIEKAGYKVAN
ncbi:MAG TPA: cation transporter [Verrucomicrobiae bacterium]|jgi:copper chaperone CopZ